MLTADDASRLRDCVAAGGVAVFPADTVYGLACDPLNREAVRRLFQLKGRPPDRPAAVMFFPLAAALEALPELGERERGALRALLPGPFTLLLPNGEDRYPLACRLAAALPAAAGAPAVTEDPRAAAVTEDPRAAAVTEDPQEPASRERTRTGKDAALGLRVPLLPPALAALRTMDLPVMQSSANLSGGPEPRRLMDVPPALLAGADLLLDGGELPGLASTVLDLREYETRGVWRIVREGPVGALEVGRALDPNARI